MTATAKPLATVRIGKDRTRPPVMRRTMSDDPAAPIDLKAAGYRMLLYCESPPQAAEKTENSCQSADQHVAVTENSQQPTMRR